MLPLIDRARRFVREGSYGELWPLLMDCVIAGNIEAMLAVKLLARDMFGGHTYNWLMKAPAAYCLAVWGKEGLKALVENAIDEPTSKNFSLAFQFLSGIAESQEPQSIASSVKSAELRRAVTSAVRDWNTLAIPARTQLHRLMLSIEDDDDAGMYVSTALMGLSLQDSDAVGNLSRALALRSIAVGPKILSKYDDLVTGSANDETLFQHFFESHPLLLDPRAVQVWAKPDFHGRLEPDFMVRTYDNKYVVVEIETPGKMLVTQQLQLGADTTHAISQVLQYQDYLRTHFTAASQVFPGFTTPDGLVVVGQEHLLTEKQKAALRSENQSRSNIKIVGFDTLADAAKVVTSTVMQGIPGAIKNARLS